MISWTLYKRVVKAQYRIALITEFDQAGIKQQMIARFYATVPVSSMSTQKEDAVLLHIIGTATSLSIVDGSQTLEIVDSQ